MPLVCPSCGFRDKPEAVVRLELCPKCGSEDRDVYLVDEAHPSGPRRDLMGLLDTAREQLRRAGRGARPEIRRKESQ